MRFFLIIIISMQFFVIKKSIAFEFTPEVCKEYGLGKNWYCGEEKEKEEKTDENLISAKDIMDSKVSPEEKAAQLNELWEVQRKRAVITADRKEIKRFLETHYLITDKGIDFAKNVQKIIDADPNFAKSESYYKNVSEEQIKNEEKERILKNAKNRYGIAFVYSAECQYCQRQVPIIHQFKEEYKLKVMGVTSSEEYFPGLDENIIDTNIVNDPLVKSFPTILLLDKKNPKKLFIAKGLTTFADLESKIVDRIKEHEEEEERNETKIE